jgi:hypothetical protein
LMLPSCGLIDHVTAVFELPLTVGVKVAFAPPVSNTLPGAKLRLTGGGALASNVTDAVAVLVGSAALVAVTTIVSCEATLAGAV